MAERIFDLSGRPRTPSKGGVISIGCFDGIHLGHQKIISVMQSLSEKRGVKTGLYLFHPHPFQALHPGKPFRRLFTLRETERILSAFALDFTGVIPFTKEFSSLSPEKFARSFIVQKLQPSILVVGYDFSFGKDRGGQVSDLRVWGEREGFQVVQVSAELRDGAPVSSSRVKTALSQGRTETARRLCGRPFFFEAPVVRGKGRGRSLGFPTANLSLHKEKFLPKAGVYGARACLKGAEDWKPAVLNIGHRPTFSASNELTVEVHIIGGSFDLYHRTLKVETGPFIRRERRFESPVKLRAQIQKDIQTALNDFPP